MTLTKEQKEFLRILKNALGITSLAIQEYGIKKTEYEEWLDNPIFEEEVNKIGEMTLDFVENQLIKEIRNGNMQAIQYYLKTKGKKRGYN